MGNYLFMLENHLTPAQSSAMTAVQEAAAVNECNVFLTGSAMRDVFGGFPVRELEFVVEGSAAKVARSVQGAASITAEESLKQARVVLASGLELRILTARHERYAKPGGKPQITLTGIHEHLRNRDFTINTIAISLSRSSKGLLLDPNNGLSDLEHKELRAVTNYALYDQPVRLLQLVRLKAQLGYTVAPKTQSQYENAKAAGVEKHLASDAMLTELRLAARDNNPGAIIEAWANEGLLARVSPALAGARLNLPGFAKLAKARQSVPFGSEIQTDDFALFLWVLTEKLTAKERTDLADAIGLPKEAAENWHRLETRSMRLAKELETAAKPSAVYAAISRVPAERPLFLLMANVGRAVHERVRNYFSKYLPAALEVTDADVLMPGLTPGSPKWEKRKAEIIAKRLDARPKKVPEPAIEPAPLPPVTPPARGARSY